FTAVNAIVDAAKATFTLLWSDFKTRFPETATVVETAWGNVKSFTQTMSDSVSEHMGTLIDAVAEFGTDSLSEIVAWATGNETEFTATQKIWETFKETVSGITTDFVTEVGPPIIEWFSET